MYFLFTLIFFIPLFGSDYCGLSYEIPTLKTDTLCCNPLSSSSTLLSSPVLTVEINNNNSSLSWSQKHDYAYRFPEIAALYRNGHAQDLVKAGNDISIWRCIGNPTLKMKKDYINFLTQGENKQHLLRLARIALIKTPRRMRIELDRFYKETRDPVQRCHAIVLADKMTGGGVFIPNGYLPQAQHIPADGNPGQFVGRDFLAEIKDKAPHAQDLIDVQMAKYAIERYLPHIGSSLTPQITEQYLKEILSIVEKLPFEYQRPLILAGIEGLYSKFTDPLATIDSHKQQVWEVSQSLINSITKASARDIYCIPQSIVDLPGDVHEMINKYSSDELAYKVGERVGDSVYMIAYYFGLKQAISGVNLVRATFTHDGITQVFSIVAPAVSNGGKSAISIVPAASSAEELARGMVQVLAEQNGCILTKKTGELENWDCLLKQGEKTSDIFNKIEDLGPAQEKEIPNKGSIIIRSIDDKNNATCRDFSKSYGKDLSTLEYQLPDKIIKMRYHETMESFQKAVARSNLTIIKPGK